MNIEREQNIINLNLLHIKVYFFYSIVREMLNCITSGLYVSANVMSMCCIDYMGVPIAGEGKNGSKHFKEFMENYMGKANHKYEDEVVQDKIWAIRCSLVHTFGKSGKLKPWEKMALHFFYENDYYNEHLFTDDKNFYLSDSKFVSEVISGVEEYFRKNRDHDSLVK